MADGIEWKKLYLNSEAQLKNLNLKIRDLGDYDDCVRNSSPVRDTYFVSQFQNDDLGNDGSWPIEINLDLYGNNNQTTLGNRRGSINTAIQLNNMAGLIAKKGQAPPKQPPSAKDSKRSILSNKPVPKPETPIKDMASLMGDSSKKKVVKANVSAKPEPEKKKSLWN